MNNTFDKFLHERGISVSELSRKAKVSRTTITDIMKGRKKNVTLETAKRLSKGIGCDITALFPDIK